MLHDVTGQETIGSVTSLVRFDFVNHVSIFPFFICFVFCWYLFVLSNHCIMAFDNKLYTCTTTKIDKLANFHISLFIQAISLSKQLIDYKENGPKTDPWGTSILTFTQKPEVTSTRHEGQVVKEEKKEVKEVVNVVDEDGDEVMVLTVRGVCWCVLEQRLVMLLWVKPHQHFLTWKKAYTYCVLLILPNIYQRPWRPQNISILV